MTSAAGSITLIVMNSAASVDRTARQGLLVIADAIIENTWNICSKRYKLYNKPTVSLNGRLKRTLGRAILADHAIELSVVNFAMYVPQFVSDIIPHEVAHIVAWKIHKDNAHGYGWREVMRYLKLKPIVTYEQEFFK